MGRCGIRCREIAGIGDGEGQLHLFIIRGMCRLKLDLFIQNLNQNRL